jgi:hypothetical protein
MTRRRGLDRDGRVDGQARQDGTGAAEARGTKMRECQIYEGGQWSLLSAKSAPGRHGDMRCPECRDRVQFYTTSRDGRQPAHFEHGRRPNHQAAHDGCRLAPRQYSGTRSRHPEAL